MLDIVTYNIRGLNNKKSFVKDFITSNKLNFLALLETKVKQDFAADISKSLAPSFSWMFNYEHSPIGRIWIGWDSAHWSLSLLSKSAQAITVSVSRTLEPHTQFVITVVYALNTYVERRNLWHELSIIEANLSSKAWICSGDFNAIIDITENLGGDESWNIGMTEFKDSLISNGLVDLKSVGEHLTWWNSSPANPVYRKLDRVVVNGEWLRLFPLSFVHFMPRLLSDHSAAFTTLGVDWKRVGKPFQVFHHLLHHPDFLEVVKRAWDPVVMGDPWFVLSTKLKKVKSNLKALNTTNGNLRTNVDVARKALCDFQMLMNKPPSHDDILKEGALRLSYSQALLEEEEFFRQKSRVTWVNKGDNNNSYFFNYCKGRWNSNKIIAIQDKFGELKMGHENVARVAVSHFEDLLGNEGVVLDIPMSLTLPQLSPVLADTLSKDISAHEVYATLKSMAKSKSPGPDGFSVEFFISAWNIVGGEVTKAALFFFSSFNLPRFVNATALALIPKNSNATTMDDFRPIACCNVLYKLIAKILANRMKPILGSLISQNQAAFIPGRIMGDNILLAQALCRGYHLDKGPSRCTIKLDLKKAFDSLNWKFLFSAMTRMGFPQVFIAWVYKCVTTTSFSVKLNGALEGFFNGKAGLRQGDPLSPYLFVIAMEVFTACLKNSTIGPDFKFHLKTEIGEITHLTFADDVLLFSSGDVKSVNCLLNGIELFSRVSGLLPNPNKSEIFFCNVPVRSICKILNNSGFSWGELPVKYLGLPLITTKLSLSDCQPLIARICDRILNWTSRKLSQGGRLQLLKATLYGILGFWLSHLFLQKGMLHSIQSIFAKFLWAGSLTNTAVHKVAWKDCCLPKSEGGLGLKDLHEWNNAAIYFQLWRIIQPSTSSLWVAWFKNNVLRRKGFWTVSTNSSCSWATKKILKARDNVIQYIRYNVGTESSFLLWHDPWVRNKPLISQLDNRLISIIESSHLAKVGSIVRDGRWELHDSNHHFAMEFRDLVSAITIHPHDFLTWDGEKLESVRIASIWNSIRSTADGFFWLKAIWHPLSIPKCSIMLWLALKNRLLTKDRMLGFGMQVDQKCFFCNDNETVQHLLVACPYMCDILKCGPTYIPPDWISNIRNLAINLKNQVLFLFLGVAFHNLWMERNDRLHGKTPISSTALAYKIQQIVRDRVFSCKKFQKAAKKDFSLISSLY